MASAAYHASLSTLRAINYRLTSTPDDQLPQVAAQLSSSIWNCREILSRSAVSKQESELSGALHRFKTHLATLLQHRNLYARWAGAVLAKATIEAGGLEVLSKSLPWVRHLLGILKRPDPPTTRVLAVVLLTRIFTLTWEHTNLIREITTPSLPTFIATCLNNIGNDGCSPRELEAVLESFSVLLPHHPTLFRPHDAAIRDHCNVVLSATGSSLDGSPRYYTKAHQATSRRLLVQIHYCAPKQAGNERWAELLHAQIVSAHASADVLFRGVEEEWTSTSSVQPSQPRHLLFNMPEPELEDGGSGGLVALGAWKGVWAGAHRIQALLQLIAASLQSSTSAAVSVRLGAVMDLLARLLSIQSSVAGQSAHVRFHPQIMRDEKDAVMSALPIVQIAALKLVCAMLTRFRRAAAPLVATLLEHVLSVAPASHSNEALRTQIYRTLEHILERSGATMSRTDVTTLAPLLRRSCEDILPPVEMSTTPKPLQITNASNKQAQQNGHVPASKTSAAIEGSRSPLARAARTLLCVALSTLPASHIPIKTRTLIDRTAVLTCDKDLLVASVLNPARKEKSLRTQPSLMPFLARMFPDCAEVEALVRPRMPVLKSGGPGQQPNGVDGEDGDSEEEADDYDDDNDVRDVGHNDIDVDHVEEVGGATSNGMNFPSAASSVSAPPNNMISRSTDQIAPTMNNVQSSASTTLAHKRPAEEPATIGSMLSESITAASASTTALATKRVRFSPPVTDAAAAGPSLLDDLEAQLQGDAMASDGADTAVSGASTTIAARTSSHPPSDEDDGSDFEMPPLTMEMDTDEEE